MEIDSHLDMLECLLRNMTNTYVGVDNFESSDLPSYFDSIEDSNLRKPGSCCEENTAVPENHIKALEGLISRMQRIKEQHQSMDHSDYRCKLLESEEMQRTEVDSLHILRRYNRLSIVLKSRGLPVDVILAKQFQMPLLHFLSEETFLGYFIFRGNKELYLPKSILVIGRQFGQLAKTFLAEFHSLYFFPSFQEFQSSFDDKLCFPDTRIDYILLDWNDLSSADFLDLIFLRILKSRYPEAKVIPDTLYVKCNPVAKRGQFSCIRPKEACFGRFSYNSKISILDLLENRSAEFTTSFEVLKNSNASFMQVGFFAFPNELGLSGKFGKVQIGDTSSLQFRKGDVVSLSIKIVLQSDKIFLDTDFKITRNQKLDSNPFTLMQAKPGTEITDRFGKTCQMKKPWLLSGRSNDHVREIVKNFISV